jgi:hypothetical protein
VLSNSIPATVEERSYFTARRTSLAAISHVWQACWQRSLSWVWFFAGVALLTGGFHFRILPASRIVTAQGTPLAAVAIALGCFVAVFASAVLWQMLQPARSNFHIVQRTCLSLMLASMLCVWACIGPLTANFIAHGRFVRMAVWFVSFAVLQLAWLREWDRHLKTRLPQIWRERDLITWPDAILVATVAVFAAEMATYGDRPYIQITPFALVMNIALLSAATAMVWGIVGRGLFGSATTVLGYFVLSFANAQKLKHLDVGLQPGDQTYLGELFYFQEFFQPKLLALAGLCLAVVLGLLVWTWRLSNRRLSLANRGRMFVGAACSLLAVGALPWLPGSREVFQQLGVVEETWDSQMSVKRNGLLVELAMQLPQSYVPAPSGYNAAKIARIIDEREKTTASAEPNIKPTQPASLMVFFFEALINPSDFGRPLTREVVPNFRQLQTEGQAGYAITPRFANGSAESEFALLTGMSCSFLPPNSCAYKHFIKRDMPSLVTVLRSQLDYRSTAVKCVTPGFYNFNEAYQHLQFDRFCADQNFVHLTFDKFSGHLADNSFVEEMLRPLDRPPAFVVGENLGSHAPYHAHMMGDKPRFLVEPSNPAGDQRETYLQAIARADDALERLVADLKSRPEPVVLLVVGDHHPPLASDSGAYDVPAFQATDAADELFRHRVPFAIWKNFESDRPGDGDSIARKPAASTSADTYVSMQFLSLLMLRAAGIPPAGLIAWIEPLYEQCPVVSRNVFYTGGAAKTWDELSPQLQRRIKEYELLQYDILLGQQYAELLWSREK